MPDFAAAETLEADNAGPARWDDACRAIEILAVDRAGLGGIALRAQAGPVRDMFLSVLGAHFPRIRRMPAAIGDEALLGGLDLTATLNAGRPILAAGLLRSAAGGLVLAAMAERIPAGVAARLTMAIDDGADLAVVALDEGIDPDERCSPALLDRLAFHVELTTLSHRDTQTDAADAEGIAAARAMLGRVAAGIDMVDALCGTALALGIGSARAVLLALRTAHASAALDGREQVDLQDAIFATRLVLAPRATQVPPPQTQEDEQQSGENMEDEPPQQQHAAPPEHAQSEQSPPPQNNDQPSGETDDQRDPQQAPASELLLEAARAAIPAGLLARLQARDYRGKSSSPGREGARQSGGQRGRPIGVRAADPGRGMRLNLIETLRAAAPWQPVRACMADAPPAGRVLLRRQDFRVTRAEQRSRTTTIFVVDASGSSALNRLAEAKGAVELLLADCYRRRDQVAVIAFRGKGAQLLLPPTRSLVRAKRSLAGLPGGGGTPLAAGIDAGFLLAETVRRGGATPTLVLLTDGRANVTRAGAGGRDIAASEAADSCRRVRFAGISSLVLDTSPRPAAEAARLAQAMGALYVPLPYADAASVSDAVRAVGRQAA